MSETRHSQPAIHHSTRPIRWKRRRFAGDFWPIIALCLGMGLVLSLSVFFFWGNGGDLLAQLIATPTPTITPTPTWTPTVTPTATPTPTPTPTDAQRISALWQRLDPVWTRGDWPAVIALLDEVRAIDPAYDDADDKLFAAHFNYGVQLIQQEELDKAVQHFTAALAIFPDDISAQGELRFALLYIQGPRRYDVADWEGAGQSFQTIFESNPEYKRTRQLLYASYYNAGWHLEQAENLATAKTRYAQALQVNPQGAEAQAALARVNAVLSPPTPTPAPAAAGKRIEVNLSTFRAIAWEGNRQVYNFLVGTGIPGSLTVPGNYTILDKIPEAYASTWGLKMPYWMGIYWGGNLENGFHALPINRYGQKLWAGYLGTRVSFGCIILADADARRLYEWAEVGIPVTVRY